MPSSFAQRYRDVRQQTMALASPLGEGDCQVQSMPDASPVKWHLAHTTWFFETFVLEPHEPRFAPFDPAFRVLFNSYYQGVGPQHPRPQRGLVTRPDLAAVQRYRAAVDARMGELLDRPLASNVLELVELGLQHEQQHQELILTDVKHLLSCNPTAPIYVPGWPLASVSVQPHAWVEYEGGLVEIGHEGAGFAFDNESPRHRVWLEPFALGSRLVTHGEWRDFVDDGGYLDSRWWLAAGWDWLRAGGIEAPLYWQRDGSAWVTFTLHGLVPMDPHTPIVHVSGYEAQAYAQWFGARHGVATRLPTEAQWEPRRRAASRGRPAARQLRGHRDAASAGTSRGR